VTRSAKAGALGLGIVGLLVLVAIAARGGHPGTNGHVATRAIPNSVQDSFITLLVIVYVAGIVAIILGLHRYPNRFRDPKSRWLLNFVLTLVLMLVATTIGYLLISHRHPSAADAQKQRARGNPATGRPSGSHVAPVPARQAHFEWPIVLGVGGLVLIGGVWMYVRGRRATLPRMPEGTLEAEIVETIEASVDDLRREPDARRAVIAAYAQLERTLARHGLARRRSEAPFEYLARVLRQLNVGEAAVRTLTGLFEYAKFSRHPVDAVMKEEAIAALLAVRDDLQAVREAAA
jgi:multisubunit Na+/H+ antiporter MnhB subunit